MTKAEAKVWGNPNWKHTKTYTIGIGNHHALVYTHTNGATLTCDSYYGDSILNMHGNVQNIEMNYEILEAYGLL
jgi:hypothetical protein